MTSSTALPPVSTVLFDLYGTLVDIEVDEQAPELWRAMSSQLQGHGVDFTPREARARFLELCAAEPDEHHGSVLPSVFGRLLSENGHRVSAHDVVSLATVFRVMSIRSLSVRPYTWSLVTLLQRGGIRLGLVSNTESILSNFDLDVLGLRPAFQAIVLSSDLRLAKPDPRVMHSALRQLHADPGMAVMVGDFWDTDIVGARVAGLRAVYLQPGDTAPTLPDPGRPGTAAVSARPELKSLLDALRTLGARI